MQPNYEDLTYLELLILIDKAVISVNERLIRICQEIKEIKTLSNNKRSLTASLN